MDGQILQRRSATTCRRSKKIMEMSFLWKRPTNIAQSTKPSVLTILIVGKIDGKIGQVGKTLTHQLDTERCGLWWDAEIKALVQKGSLGELHQNGQTTDDYKKIKNLAADTLIRF